MHNIKYIKEYKTYISDDKERKDFPTDGLYVEYLYNLNDGLKNLIKDYIEEYDPTIRVSNVIDNMMPEGIRINLLDALSRMHMDEISESIKPGRNVFKSFLKVVSAMGGRSNHNIGINTPDSFIIYYRVDNIDTDKFKSIIDNRFKSLKNYIELSNDIDTHIYFGITLDNKFEYGIVSGNNHNMVGTFTLTESSKKWLIGLNSQSATSLKKDLIETSTTDIKLLSRIKSDVISTLNGELLQRSGIYLDDNILVVPINDIGIWKDGAITDESLKGVRVKLNSLILKYKWSDKVLTSITPDNYNIIFFIKLK